MVGDANPATAAAAAAPDIRNLETVEVSKSLLEEIIRKSESSKKEPVFSLIPKDLEECRAYAAIIAKTELCPESYRGKPDEIVIAIMRGLDVGLKPLQALDCIAVINGRAAIWGDGALALCLASGLLEDFRELSGSDALAMGSGHCVAKRRGMATPVDVKFTIDDAKTAGLWGKTGKNGYPTPWVLYPGRMLQMRARGFALRDKFADVLKGLAIVEEVRDYAPSAEIGALIEETLKMPKRKESNGGAPAGSATAPAAGLAASAPPPGRPAAPAGAKGAWSGKISKVQIFEYPVTDQKTGKPTGKTANWWKAIAADGTLFATFSKTNATKLAEIQAAGGEIGIEWERTPGKENLKILSMSPITPPEKAPSLAQVPTEEDLPFDEPGSAG